MSTFDFGEGPVPAHQHKNPRGRTGGWVADTAHVAQTAYVATDARVFGNAVVSGFAQMFNSAQAYENALIFGDAQLSGKARLYGAAQMSGSARAGESARLHGSAQVSDSARLLGSAQVSGIACLRGDVCVTDGAEVLVPHHVIHMDGLGENGSLTMFRTEGGGHVVRAGCWSGTLAAMRDNLAMPHAHGWDNPERCETQYLSVLPLLAAHKKLWKREG